MLKTRSLLIAPAVLALAAAACSAEIGQSAESSGTSAEAVHSGGGGNNNRSG